LGGGAWCWHLVARSAALPASLPSLRPKGLPTYHSQPGGLPTYHSVPRGSSPLLGAGQNEGSDFPKFSARRTDHLTPPCWHWMNPHFLGYLPAPEMEGGCPHARRGGVERQANGKNWSGRAAQCTSAAAVGTEALNRNSCMHLGCGGGVWGPLVRPCKCVPPARIAPSQPPRALPTW